MLKLGDHANQGEVVYIRGSYYAVKRTSEIYADMYAVHHEGYPWRLLLLEGDAFGTALQKCIDWIARRKCFKK